MLRKIISGGQTGVERAALDSAIQMTAFSFGGWCPSGKIVEDGQLAQKYFVSPFSGCGLQESDSSRPAQRIRMNIQDADATLILRSNRLLPERIKLCIKMLRDAQKSYQICDPHKVYTVPRIVQWICETNCDGKSIEILNITGPTERESKGIYDQSFQYLTDVFHLVALYLRHGVKIWNPKQNNQNNKNPID